MVERYVARRPVNAQLVDALTLITVTRMNEGAELREATIGVVVGIALSPNEVFGR